SFMERRVPLCRISQAGQGTLTEDGTIQQRFPTFGANSGQLIMVSATPRVSKEPARKPLRNGSLRLGHHETKPERGEGGNTRQGKKGAIITRRLDNHATDGVAQRCANAGGGANCAVCEVEAAGAAGEISHHED